MSEELPAIPPTWCWAPLGEIAEVKLGKMLSGKSFEDGLLQLPYLRNQNVRWGHIDYNDLKTMGFKASEVERYSLEPGDLLVCEGGEPGRCAIYNRGSKELMYQKALHRIRPHGGFASPLFLQFCLWHYASNGVVLPRPSETTIQHLPLEEMQELPIPVAPIEEQQRIVGEIEKHFTGLDAAVASLQRVQANLKRYRAAVLKAACEGRLVPTEAELARAEGRGYETANEMLERTKRPGCSASQQAGLAQLPVGWAWVSLENLAAREANSITDGPFGSNLKTSHYTSSGPRVIRLQNIGETVFLDERAHISGSHYQRLQKHRIEQGDLAIALLGERLPRACIIPPKIGLAIVKADCVRFKPDAHLVSAQYLNLTLNADPLRRTVAATIHGVGRPRLRLSELKSIAIPLPPRREQDRIVRETERLLSIVAEVESEVSRELTRADLLRQGILQNAFAGRLGAQDPNDEPASVLLERIRQAKASQTSEPRTRKARTKPVLASPPPSPPPPVLAKEPPTVAEPEPEPQEADFLELSRDEQVDLAWELLLGQGPLEKDTAVRTVADGLRDRDLARFKRLRQDGPLYGAIVAAIEKGVREGDFDRPRRGCMRAVLTDPKDYTEEVWQRCLLAVIGDEPVEIEDTLRAAAEWARKTMGLEFARLREDGVILTGLREALEDEMRAGRVVRRGGRVRRPAGPTGRETPAQG